MSKIFFRIGNTSTESVSPNQTALAILPETLRPSVVPTYSRQLYKNLKIVVQLGNARNILSAHIIPRLRSAGDTEVETKKQDLANLENRLCPLSEDRSQRAQVFLGYLSAHRCIDRRLYPLMEKVRRRTPLTSKDLNPLVDVVYHAARKNASATSSHKQKIRDYLQTGEVEPATYDWLARFIDPIFHLALRRQTLATKIRELERQKPVWDESKVTRDVEAIIDGIKTGKEGSSTTAGLDVRCCLAQAIGVEPRSRFVAEITEVGEGLNKLGCLIVDRNKNFLDMSDGAPSFVALDKISRVVTALDRTLSHIVVAFADHDEKMKELCRAHVIHSGLLIRGLLGENEAIRTLYPIHAVGIPDQPALNEAMIARVRDAYEKESLAPFCAQRFGLPEDQLAAGIERAVAIQRKILPLLPLEVHRLADAMEARIRLLKFAEKMNAAKGPPMTQQQAVSLRLAIRAQELRHKDIRNTLKADFHFDAAKLFHLDDLLIDRIKSLFGNELEFLRLVLANYIERNKASKSSASGDLADRQRSA